MSGAWHPKGFWKDEALVLSLKECGALLVHGDADDRLRVFEGIGADRSTVEDVFASPNMGTEAIIHADETPAIFEGAHHDVV